VSQPEKEQMFRKVALERLSSPEQLDLMMQVTSPKSWIALGGLGVLLTAAVVWAFYGTVPTKVQASGVLIRPGGVFDVFSSGTGPLREVVVREGEMVTRGQVIARVEQPELEREIENQRIRLGELQSQHRERATYAARDLGLKADTQTLQESQLKDTIAFAEQRLASLRDQIASEEALLEKGLITRQTVLQTRQAYFATQDLLERSKSDVRQLPIAQLTTRTQSDQELLQSQLRINETQRQLEVLQRQLAQVSAVASPYDGRVVEVKRDRGDIVAVGTPLVSLELVGQDVQGLQVVGYVNPSDGKNVMREMEVQISPTTASREEYGFLRGKVSYVSEFPSTPDGMMRVLANPTLVQGLSAGGPPFAVYVDLEPDSESVSGYKWSSFKGNEVPVNSGTICTISITIRERRPVDLVIPLLRTALGL
jgi:HlyD family secretion protein